MERGGGRRIVHTKQVTSTSQRQTHSTGKEEGLGLKKLSSFLGKLGVLLRPKD